MSYEDFNPQIETLKHTVNDRKLSQNQAAILEADEKEVSDITHMESSIATVSFRSKFKDNGAAK